MNETLKDYWKRTAAGVNRHIATNANHTLEDCLEHLIAFMAQSVEDTSNRATQNQQLLGTVDGLVILAFDATRGALQSQRVLCLAGTATTARVCFEACCTLQFIAGARPLASAYATRYSNWKHVETLEHYRKTGEALPWDELVQHGLQASEWLEPDSFRVRKGAHWANDPQFGDLFAIARHLGLEEGYRKIYGSGSAFVHASSTVTRLYRVGGQLRSIADTKHVSRFAWLAGNLALKLQRSFLESLRDRLRRYRSGELARKVYGCLRGDRARLNLRALDAQDCGPTKSTRRHLGRMSLPRQAKDGNDEVPIACAPTPCSSCGLPKGLSSFGGAAGTGALSSGEPESD
jgi:hypothetical protein